MSGQILPEYEPKETKDFLLSCKSTPGIFATFCASLCPESARAFFLREMCLRDGERYEVLRCFRDRFERGVFEIEVPREPNFHDDCSYARVYVSSSFFTPIEKFAKA